MSEALDRLGDLRSGLVGRESELAEVGRFLELVRSTGASRLIVGDAGLGKTRMLQEAAARATESGIRVLVASGVEFEADMSYSGLNHILYPLLDGLPALGALHRDSLSVALGLGDGPTPDRLVVYNAALALLGHAAKAQPVLLIVDDLPWIDPASSAALGFIARRTEGTRIGFLASTREGVVAAPGRSGVREATLRPLTRANAERLLADHRPGLTARARRRLLDQAGGNPLAILELADGLAHLPQEALDDLPEILPLTTRLETSFAFRIADFPDATRRALLLLALDGRDDLRAVTQADVTLDHLAPAERAGLITVDLVRSSVHFRHTLVRSAVVGHSSSDERRRAHLDIAQHLADDPERLAWHRAEAAIDVDEETASLLEAVARMSLGRGDARAATNALRRAAALSPRAPDRQRRLAEAAYLGAVVTGETENATDLLEAERPFVAGPGALHAAVAAAYLFVNQGGDYGTAHRMIVGAIEADDHGWRADDDELIQAQVTWMIFCWLAGREEYWAQYFEVLHRLRPEAPEALWVASQAFPDTVRTGAAVRERLKPLLLAQDEGRDPNIVIRLNTAAVYLDLLGLARTTAWNMIEDGRHGGAMRAYMRSLVHMCLDCYATGQWQLAQQLTDEGEAAAKAGEYHSELWYYHYMEALLAAVRGNIEDAFEWAAELDRVELRRDARGALKFAYHARTLAAQAAGDWESAYRFASALSPAGTFAPFTPHAMWVAYDLVESGVRTGRLDAARAHAAEMVRVDLPAISPRLALLTAGASALVAAEPVWEQAFEAAISTPGASDWPFDLARVQLAYGERLRREFRSTEARAILHLALDAFDRIGAEPWSLRARAELRAARERTRQPGAESLLTPQERAVAELAAEGLSNKEIARRLFLAPRTVSGHLYRVFPKLGITSRASLRDALTVAALDDDPASPGAAQS